MMSALENHKWELFSQGLAAGLSQGEAYREAGYKLGPGADASASRLLKNDKIINRVEELKQRSAVRVSLTKSYLLDAAVENLEKSLGRKPVKITRREKCGDDEYEDVTSEVFVYKGDVANQALKLLGNELALFTERKDVRITNEYSKMSDADLARRLVEVGQQMLLEGPDLVAGVGPVIEHEEDDDGSA